MEESEGIMKPYWQQDGNIIYQGHALDILLKDLEPESIQMICTSPPYWGLRDYGLPPMIWDEGEAFKYMIGKPTKCNHDWDITHHKDTRGVEGSGLSGRIPYKEGEARLNYSEGFCQLCGAWRGSLGLEPTPELYIKHIVQIFREVKRVLRKDGTVWLNLGDSYATHASGGKGHKHNFREWDVCKKEGIDQPKPTAKSIGLKEKDLCGIPWRVALALQADGWWLRQDIIWSKPNPMPESVTDRCTKSHEYVFLLTKSGTNQYWTHRDHSGTREKPKADWRWVNQIDKTEVATPPDDWKVKIICPECNSVGIADVDISYVFMGKLVDCHQSEKCPVCDGKKKVQKWKRINLWRGHDYFFDNEAIKEETTGNAHPRGTGVNPKAKWKTPDGWDTSKGKGDHGSFHKNGREKGYRGYKYKVKQNESFSAAVKDLVSTRNKRTIWQIATQPMPEAHFATFPEALVIPCILAGTSEKGCCPECGAPWERVVEKRVPEMRDAKSRYPGEHSIATRKYKHNNSGPESITIGWKPTCGCFKPFPKYPMPDPVPCTVLDLFFGSGTVGIVAHKHGRNFIGIELSKPYLDDIAIPRIERETAQTKWC